MKEQIIIETDTAGKNLYETTQETCEGYADQLERIHKWILEMEGYEKLEQQYQTGQDFQTIKNLYQLHALFTISSSDLSIIFTQMYLCKVKLQLLYFIRQANLVVYEAYENYSKQKSFLRTLVQNDYPELMPELDGINEVEKTFVRGYRIKTEVMNIRHRAAGHIHSDFKLWYASVVSLDAEHSAQMTIAFMAMFKLIHELTTKLTALQHQKFLDFSAKSTRSAKAEIDKVEALMDAINLNQPNGQKLDFDIQSLRDLLK
jgi:hypothetical protein